MRYFAGDPLKFTGVNSAGQLKVEKITTTDVARAVLTKADKSGEIKAVVVSGDVICKVGGVITVPGQIASNGGIVAYTSGTTSASYGYARGTTAADGDYVLVTLIETA